MRYSVIIPVYNVQDKLSRCIDSLICQSFHDYEIILVNDGSADHSGEICQKYAKQFEFIKYIEKENGGASSARNTGLDNAVGDYVLFIDSDDYAEENYFEMISQYSVQNGLCVFTYTWKRQNGFQKRNIDLSMTQKSISHFEITKQLILSRTINSPCAKVFDRNLIEKYNLRFDEKMPVAEDFNFCLAYLMRCDNVCVVNESVYVYDMSNENSLVHKRKKGMIDIYPYVFDTAYQTINTSSFSKEEKEQLFRIWDKLHTDSFITCVMEEQKDDNMKLSERLSSIRNMCKKFYRKYPPKHGYQNIIHFMVRFCIKYRLTLTLEVMCQIYAGLRG